MKNPTQMISISILALVLLFVRISLPILFQKSSPTILIILNIITILTLIAICSIFLVYRSFNYKLISQKLIVTVVLLKICILILESILIKLLEAGETEYSKYYFAILLFFKTLIPLVLLWYILSFQEVTLKVTQSFPVILIIGLTTGIVLTGRHIKETDIGFMIYTINYPLPSLAILIQLCLFLTGFIILRLIFSSSNFVLMKFSPMLIRQNIIIILGLVFYFFISPIFDLLLKFDMEHSTEIYHFYEFIQLLSILLIVLPNFYSTESSFNLIPQSVEKFVVMSNSGIPFISYDFGFSERVLHSELLVTSSLSAIMTYLTHSEIISRRIENIKFQDRILMFRSVKGLTFILIVKKQTKVIESGLNVFIKEFTKGTSPNLSEKAYYRTSDLKNLKLQELIEECFGTNFVPSPDPDTQQIVSDKKSERVLIGRLVISFVLAISSQRLVIFHASTILLPEENDLFGIGFILLYISLVYLGSQTFIMNKLREVPNLFYINISLFLILSIIPQNPLFQILSWVFAFLSWGYLISTWIYDFNQLNRESRYQLFILGFAMDIGLRFVSIGTELLIFNLSYILLYKAVITVIFVLVDRTFRIEGNNNKTTKINHLSSTTFSIAIIFALKYSLNIGSYLRTFTDVNFVSYMMYSISWLIILLFLASNFVISCIYKNTRISFIVSLVILTVLILDINPFMEIILGLLSPVAICFILSLGDNDLVLDRFEISNRISNLLHFIIPTGMMSIIALTLYGLNDLLFLGPLIIFFLLHLPLKNLQYSKITNIQITAIGMILLIIVSFAIPFNFSDSSEYRNNSNSIGLMTYNIQYGVNTENEYNPIEIADFIINSGVHIVALQEVTRGNLINGGGDLFLQLSLILRNHGFQYISLLTNEPDTITNVLFSKFPIVSSEGHFFHENVVYKRGFTKSRIEIGSSEVHIINTHLTHVYSRNANITRNKQFDQLISAISNTETTILTGDLNVEPFNNDILRLSNVISDQWNTEENGYTWPTEDPAMRIDYIFANHLTFTNIYVGDSQTSDHLPVIAWFKL